MMVRHCTHCGKGRMRLVNMRLLPSMHSLHTYKCDNLMCGYIERVMK
jgi:hypothetical protein